MELKGRGHLSLDYYDFILDGLMPAYTIYLVIYDSELSDV